MAYAFLSLQHARVGESGRAAEYARKAYDLRARVSERERFFIEGNYYDLVTGDLEKGAQTFELWQQTYPGDFIPYNRLGRIYAMTRSWEKRLEEWREGIRLQPNTYMFYAHLGEAYISLNRLDEAEAVCKQAQERNFENNTLLRNRYWLAFLKGDAAQMAQMVSTAMGKPGMEDRLLATQADTEGWYGKLRNARELTRRAMDSALQNDAKETAAGYEVDDALREVEVGIRAQAQADANAALKLAPDRYVQCVAALALAQAGDTAGAEKLAVEIDRSFPMDTMVQGYWLPTIRAGIALERKDPARAIEPLKVARTFDELVEGLYAAYLRGEAYLMLHDGNAAAAEFQKLIERRGLVLNSPWGALARLGLARAYALQGNTAKARAAYQDFLTIWKDADPEVPILKEAKAEYARLQ
jgi:tetratricopeptide (TPR) repeat protein